MSGAVQQPSHQPVSPVHVDEYPLDFIASQHRRQPFRSLGTIELAEFTGITPEHFPVHEDDGVERLILCRG